MGHFAGGDPWNSDMEAHQMSGWEGILLATITLSSCWVCYHLGQRNMFYRMRDIQEKRRRWAEWEDFED
jgi:hypothetical protein